MLTRSSGAMLFSPGNSILLACIALLLFASITSFIHPDILITTYGLASNSKYKERKIGDAGLKKFSWSALQPSADLSWHDCYSSHQCARLIVPLNYSEPNGEEAVIALARYPSPLSTNSPWYRGPILINPGGPGGSGVDTVVGSGHLLSSIVGPQFDVVGFDPRGVGRSTPRISFFETELERILWGSVGPRGSLTILNASTDSLAAAWARAKIEGQLARERQIDVIGHINTDQTARDMLQITHAHGKEKLQYWGFSYGSVLGATFAAIFPDKVDRLIIDGVADVENYYSTLWSNNLLDTDRTMASFFTECHSAGPVRCPFYAPTPAAIAQNLTALYDSVRSRPIPVRTGSSYGLIDYKRLRLTVFASLYKPYTAFAPLAQALADLAVGDGVQLFQLLDKPAFQCDCDETGDETGEMTPDTGTAISCNDGDAVPEEFEALESYFEDVSSKSQWAEIWAGLRTACVGWPKVPTKQFRGPFVGNTSFPILLIGNTADPVTPLAAAKITAKGFPSSVVLTQDSPGHCSLSAPSLCTMKYIRDYFVDGTLPKPDTICPVFDSPFPPPPGYQHDAAQAALQKSLSAADHRILDAVRTLSSEYKLPLPFL
ncbi:hypothetical protein Hypma_012562 [Hypsizygus marmoreus]|uniref:Tripeptidyl aminopeptidase n=1 Tax=Hypsizygus marmoreus TaxID=39966 RepID=A0A369JEF9_HYPMA|nr:hypothetical protein Hypma_012562 [Hypsizygus marmoreus]